MTYQYQHIDADYRAKVRAERRAAIARKHRPGIMYLDQSTGRTFADRITDLLIRNNPKVQP